MISTESRTTTRDLREPHLEGLEGRSRTIIEGVTPEIDCGRFAIKRVVGESVTVTAIMFADGHDEIAARLLYRHESDRDWQSAPMKFVMNDRWQGRFPVERLGRYLYTLESYIDRFGTWQHDLAKRVKAGQDVRVELLIGANLVDAAIELASGQDRKDLQQAAQLLREPDAHDRAREVALGAELAQLMARYPDRRFVSRYGKELPVTVDRVRARCSTWYELFPRSCSPQRGQHGTLRDCAAQVPRIAAMGFDVLYLPPTHPIGTTFRKGKNNAVSAQPGDVGSPWAIGAPEGGHQAIHPQLGTLADFRYLVQTAKEHGMELALDIAFQCTPDHPYVKEHPSWFRSRPDGTIQYAENPPKKYQDIYPLDFESPKWQALWSELKEVMEYWARQEVRIFRVDNPHTKSFLFWEWAIAELKKQYPDLIFLSEAFTRPFVMYRLAKLGFTQSYTYFTWRNSKQDLTEYLQELTTTTVREYFRPNFWPNTPDILAEALKSGGRGAFMYRLALAATLTANYGIYGPAYELCENTPREPGSEEYLNSEKYEIKYWDFNAPWRISDYIARVNRARRENAALQSNDRLVFHPTDNPHLICYSKATEDFDNVMLMVVNLDPYQTQAGWVQLNLAELGLPFDAVYSVEDWLSDGRYTWRGARNFVMLTPQTLPAHAFRIRRQ